jgi:cell division protease FtsH
MNEKKPANPWVKSLLIWVGILFGLVLFVQMIGGGSRASAGNPIAYSEFVRQVDEGNVRSVTMSATASGNSLISGRLTDGNAFSTTAPGDAQVSSKLIDKGVDVQVKSEEGSSIWLLMLYNSLPLLLIIGISFFVMRQMQKNAGSGAMGFGKSRARMLTEKAERNPPRAASRPPGFPVPVPGSKPPCSLPPRHKPPLSERRSVPRG